MAGDVGHVVVVGDHADAAAHQAVLHQYDRAFVAGDHAAAEDDGVALAQRDVGMGIGSDTGQRATRLALAASHEDQQVVVRDRSRPHLRG